MSNIIEYVRLGTAIAELFGRRDTGERGARKATRALAFIGATKEQAALAKSGMAELHAARAAKRKPDLSIEQGEALSIAGSLLSSRGKKAAKAVRSLFGSLQDAASPVRPGPEGAPDD